MLDQQQQQPKRRNRRSALTLQQASISYQYVAIETSGTWGEQASDLVREIGRRIAAVEHEPRFTVFLRQRISVAIQRGNAFCIMGTFRDTDSAASV